ncbi:hypothetical protein GCM10009785_13160 [Brooklawnia cerclae]|uniref:Multicomponent Na+:H+ antiporter subunit F n=1 Tax=Brooklawnia cerclae TaxID=349934 RepID=A0ABX0SLG2_9ACTN|nr:monovalent cation/H+ antiporter complex subunit F [Brooklawnia cerclae]NIH58769.1 multicomponent Na+:H+ antiporter subunit F [Brooklawnia cerclae]
MITVLYICLGALVVAMALVLVRLERGPSNLDRAVGLDVMTSAAVGIVVVVMALTGRVDLLPLLVVFAAVGFLGSTVIARFSQAEAIGEGRMLSREEVAAIPESMLDEAAPPVHPDAEDEEDAS